MEPKPNPQDAPQAEADTATPPAQSPDIWEVEPASDEAAKPIITDWASL